ncbi:hypothetical protein EN943_01335 [Mesorhizobium sp. M7A.F.Ca.US.006.01.1.1]|uniref:hypothetical protein n=1 Tax=Mesorhizobium sp. M7A.F.Ca.US.006.01.1.1 TaxID=2496707 RepID=UPI000FC9B3F0|nr:hypothetical protein [Mesorhizobium sp. M7A.F.Ca.US.006.01.1.1]RUZ81268.1 hypothetical protein EN943_01335 [Mesorhizobium sp. M7A.F.Ca.US.006.01.1.1]
MKTLYLRLVVATAVSLAAAPALAQTQSTNPHQPGGPHEPSPGAPPNQTYPGAAIVPIPNGGLYGGATIKGDGVDVHATGVLSPSGNVSGRADVVINPQQPTKSPEPPVETPKIGEPEPVPGIPGFPNGLDIPPEVPPSDPLPSPEPQAPSEFGPSIEPSPSLDEAPQIEELPNPADSSGDFE